VKDKKDKINGIKRFLSKINDYLGHVEHKFAFS